MHQSGSAHFGIPVRYGNMTGVALNDEGAGGVALATETVVDFGQAIWDIEVVDTGGGGIAAGDTLFFHDADPPAINSVSAAGFFLASRSRRSEPGPPTPSTCCTYPPQRPARSARARSAQ